MAKKFYITTAIDYVNAKGHLGHAYEKILADVLARWHRLNDEDVFFLTGTDENASKNAQAAKEAGIETKKFVDSNAKLFIELCKKLNLSNDYFIRTTEEKHFKISQKVFEILVKNGDIYKGEYEGHYCVGCEAFVTEKDLVNGKCPEHNKEPEWLKEESHFFRLSKYKKEIIKLLKQKVFVVPEKRSNEVLSRLENEELKDLSVSRKNLDWGIPVPGEKNFKIYIWLDALVNYISALDYPEGIKFKKYWPADVHVIGKGINWFHSVIWPAVLLSCGIKVPKQIVVHGYLTVDGKKIGKSLGNVIDPVYLINKYSPDTLRYFLIREIPFFDDGDFSEKKLIERHNNELANELGNLVSRTLSMVEKYFNGNIPEGKNELKFDVEKVDRLINKYELHNALAEIFKFIGEVNKYINDKKPWAAEDKKNILYTALDSIRIIAILLYAFIPETSENIFKQLGIKPQKLRDAEPNLLKKGKIKKGKVLFKKIL